MPDKFSFLFLGDIIGHPGRQAIKKFLPRLIKKYSPSLIIANAENSAGGLGITEEISQELLSQVHILTSGNHIWTKKEIIPYLDREPRLLRPANFPQQNPGKGSFICVDCQGRKAAVLNLQGRVFMEPIDCPFRTADRELKKLSAITSIIMVDFHAEATSEKQALGWYLDGRVSAVIGTHTHVPTADEKILPQGTAYITDVGMVGAYDSVIGIKKDQALERFLTSRPQRFEPEKGRPILSSVFVEVEPETGKALTIQKVTMTEEKSEGPDNS